MTAARPRALLRGLRFALARELLELLREPHVLVFSIGFPLVLTPLSVVALVQIAELAQGEKERSQPRIAVIGPDDLQRALGEPPTTILPDPGPVSPDGAGLQALRSGALDAIVQGRAEGDQWTVTTWYWSTHRRSRWASEAVGERLDDLREQRVSALASAAGVPPEAVARWQVRRQDHTPQGEGLRRMLGEVLPFAVLSMLFCSALYPAVDAATGERERGTVETSLTLPVPRAALGAAKVLAVALVAFGAGVGVLLSMGLTISQLLGSVTDEAVNLGLGEVALPMALSALPLAGAATLASAVMLGAATPVGTFKAAQNTASMAMIVCFLPLLPLVKPELALNWTTALLPLANAGLALRGAFDGALPLGPTLLATAVNLALAGGCVALIATLLRREGAMLGAEPMFWRRRG